MRLILLTVLLVACDQGAKPRAAAAPESEVAAAPKLSTVVPIAPPPYMVKDTADFIAKANAALDELVGIFEQGGKDCAVVASGLRRFGDVNRTRFDALVRYGEAHPDAEKALSAAMQDTMMKRITEKLMPTMTVCASDKDLKAALDGLSAMQHVQRAR